MTKRIKTTITSILFFFFINANFSLAEKVSIIYVIENDPITNVAISNEIKYLLLINKKLNEVSKEDMVQYATKSILKEKIKEIELKKYYKFGENNKIIDQNLNTFIQRFNITNNDIFYDLINEIGLSKEFIKKKINSSSNLLMEYLLYEITFSPNTMEDFRKEYAKIKKSIEEIGFESTANIFSNSSSAKLGGKIGWVNENQLSKSIINNIQNLNLGEYSESINIPSGNIILMIKDKREIKNKLSLEDELKKAISQETNKQFTQYSSIYFKKVELNTQIYEK